ncbi:MAG TPA: AraC family transcriptional regulator [Rhizomicrobium sp.]
MTLQAVAYHGENHHPGARAAIGRSEPLAPARCGDPALEHFVRAALSAEDARRVLQGFYTDALHRILLARLAELRDTEPPAAPGKVKPLQKWRLKRVCDHIDANLHNRISLKLLAQAAGVSRMYFAAQFRAATNLSPHNYVLQRRLAAAERMLAETGQCIVDIALGVGFQTQSHFTTVFKRAKGLTPHRWRALHGSVAEPHERPRNEQHIAAAAPM